MVLEFFLPDLNRSYVVSWDSKGTKQVCIDPNSLFDSDTEIGESRVMKRIPSLMTGNITVT